MTDIFENLEGWIAVYGLSIAGAIPTFVIGFFHSNSIRKVFERSLQKTKLDKTSIGFLGNLIYGLFIVFVALMALDELGVDTTSFIAVLGAAGLALKNPLQNFAACVMILVNKQFVVGQYFEAGGASGSVNEIKLFHTRLKTPDNEIIYVLISSIINSNIINYTSEDTRRCDMEISIGYSYGIDKEEDII